ncbi:MFS transporter [Escherichia coli]|uniref:MFS transporter n=1 Tax=Escherichia coli TaxID=562 RepID=UPI00031DC0FC|nr:MFS transporter [Escherichia coli]MCZ0571124.1 MFS transporter [Escherichia coli]
MTGLIHSVPFLMVIRLFLVLSKLQSCLQCLYISNWFTKSERSKANTFLILGNPITVLWMSIVSGYLIDSYGWREMFIIEGFPTVIWAVIWWCIIRDKPHEVNWLTTEEKTDIQTALDAEQSGIKPVPNYFSAFKSKIVLLSFTHFLWNIGVYGFIMWLPSIIKNADESLNIVKVGYLSAMPYFAAIILMLAGSYFSDKLQNRKLFIWPLQLIAGISFLISYVMGSDYFWISY